MALTININGLSLCHKGSNGSATATLPDVCKTPGPGQSIPVPYPNVAVSSDLAKGTKTIHVEGGYMAAHRASEISVSTGDEPGTLGGVRSGTNMKEATWLTFSFDVKLEGENACRLTDKLLMNHGNTVCLAGWIDDWLKGPKGPAECAALLAQIILIIGEGALALHGSFKGLEQRIAEQIAGGLTPSGSIGAPMDRLPNAEWPKGSNPWMRHDEAIERQQASLKRHLDAYDDHCGGQPPPPSNARAWETKTRPQPVVAPPPPATPSTFWDGLASAGKWVVGGVVVAASGVAIAALVADDATVVGILDDVAIAPVAAFGLWGASLMGGH